MAKTLLLEIVTPDKLVLSKQVASVTAQGVAGDFTILPLHVPFLSALRVGFLTFRDDSKVITVFVSGGVAEIDQEKMLVLAEAAELPKDIDVDRAIKAMERAKTRLEAQMREDVDFARAQAALQRAVLRLQLHETAVTGRGR